MKKDSKRKSYLKSDNSCRLFFLCFLLSLSIACSLLDIKGNTNIHEKYLGPESLSDDQIIGIETSKLECEYYLKVNPVKIGCEHQKQGKESEYINTLELTVENIGQGLAEYIYIDSRLTNTNNGYKYEALCTSFLRVLLPGNKVNIVCSTKGLNSCATDYELYSLLCDFSFPSETSQDENQLNDITEGVARDGVIYDSDDQSISDDLIFHADANMNHFEIQYTGERAGVMYWGGYIFEKNEDTSCQGNFQAFINDMREFHLEFDLKNSNRTFTGNFNGTAQSDTCRLEPIRDLFCDKGLFNGVIKSGNVKFVGDENNLFQYFEFNGQADVNLYFDSKRSCYRYDKSVVGDLAYPVIYYPITRSDQINLKAAVNGVIKINPDGILYIESIYLDWEEGDQIFGFSNCEGCNIPLAKGTND